MGLGFNELLFLLRLCAVNPHWKWARQIRLSMSHVKASDIYTEQRERVRVRESERRESVCVCVFGLVAGAINQLLLQI